MNKDKKDSKRKQNPKSKQSVVRKPDETELTDEQLTKVAGGARRTGGLSQIHPRWWCESLRGCFPVEP